MSYNHKLINDLAWAIGSPNLLDATDLSHPCVLDSSWSAQQLISQHSLLRLEDKTPHNIQSYLSALGGFKLGFYFENLVTYWFEIHPDYEVIARNVVIQCESEKRTLGEIDLIVKDIQRHKTIHMEIAVKFFLHVSYQGKDYWFGPNLKDRLDLKLEHLINHQIAISDKLSKYEIHEKHILLKGRIFEYSASLSKPLCWLTIDDFKKINDNESHWVILDKSFWLAEIDDAKTHFLTNDILSKQALESRISAEENHATCFAQLINNTECRRLFIVPDNWEEKAIQTLEQSSD